MGLVSPFIFNAYLTQQLRLTGMRISKPPAPLSGAQSKKPVIYQRGDRRVRRVLRLFQPLLSFSGACRVEPIAHLFF